MTLSTRAATLTRLSNPLFSGDRGRRKHVAQSDPFRKLTQLAIVLGAASLLACGGPSIGGHRNTTSSALQGTWTGESNGLVLTFTAEAARCDWGCAANARGTYLRRATGQTGSF